MMEERKKNILFNIVKEHIRSKSPVSSKGLVREYKLNVSSATVRNIMVELEEEGYIHQPYTSAGRIPTEKAYRVYLDYLFSPEAKKEWSGGIGGKELDRIKKFLGEASQDNFKQAAKLIASTSENAVFWAFNKNNLYYTGVSNLLQQPEFAKEGLIYDISAIIDQMDEIIADIFENIPGKEISVLVGSENPFGKFCSTVLTKYRSRNKNLGVFGILGPLRMNYQKNISLVGQVLKSLEGK